MITLIGTRSTAIGFGLCGIKDIHEVTEQTPEEEIRKLIREAKHHVVMIDTRVYSKVHGTFKTDKVFIQVPDRHAKEEEDDLDELMKDTIGVAIKT